MKQDNLVLAITSMSNLYSLIDQAIIIDTETPQDLKNIIDYTYSYEQMTKAVLANDEETAFVLLKRTNRLGSRLSKRIFWGSVKILHFGFKG